MFPITVQQNSSQHKMHKGLTYLLFGAVLVALPFILPEFQVGRLNRAIYLAVAVLGLQMVLGYGGLLALGHSAFIGTGAFVTTWLVMDQPFFGGDFWEFWMAIPVAMLVCAGVGALLAIPALKIKGLYLALVTIALATVFPGLAAVETLGIAEATGGVNGRELAGQKLVPPGWAEAIGFSAEEPGRYRYFPVVILALLSFWAVSNLIKSRPGRAMVAIRDNETGAAVSGVALTKSKVTSFAISASFGGLAGAMWAMDKGFVAQQDYNFFLAVDLLVALVIGGVATIPGAIVGTLIVVFVREFTKGLEVPLGFYTIDGGGPLSQAIFGFILVIVTFFAPGGLVWMFRLIRSKFYRVIPEVPELSEPVVPLGQVEEPALAMS